ncbi:transporter substrate-binding domain-containing protein [Actinophytocola sp.]|uniref:transporter substrate-binding domain-containing protein n=1 Tax=Actinophytocola sp. TaxID=1872138 RepID=UPI002ED06FD4
MTRVGAANTRRNRWKIVGALASLVALVAVAVLIWLVIDELVDRPPTAADLTEQAGLVGTAELRVGVKDDIPGVAYRDPETGEFSGFDIDIAYMIAADLGFQPHQVRFMVIEDEDRPKMRARDGDKHITVHLVIAHYSINKTREDEARVSFSAPYLFTEQSVMTRRGHTPVHDMSDLAGRPVCTVSTSTSMSPAEEADADVMPKQNYAECLRGLRDGTFEAVTSDAAILAGFVAAEPEVFEHHDIGLALTESWGVNTGGNEALRTLVNMSLRCSLTDPNDRDWEDAYDKHLRPIEKVNLPQPVAIDEQPQVDEVNVRGTPCE